jgi:hypothetical protein
VALFAVSLAVRDSSGETFLSKFNLKCPRKLYQLEFGMGRDAALMLSVFATLCWAWAPVLAVCTVQAFATTIRAFATASMVSTGTTAP